MTIYINFKKYVKTLAKQLGLMEKRQVTVGVIDQRGRETRLDNLYLCYLDDRDLKVISTTGRRSIDHHHHQTMNMLRSISDFIYLQTDGPFWLLHAQSVKLFKLFTWLRNIEYVLLSWFSAKAHGGSSALAAGASRFSFVNDWGEGLLGNFKNLC